MELLGIPKRSRRHAALALFPVLFSELLGVDAIDTASAYKMRPLSAFDAKAWPWICGRWELKEHAARKKIIRKRLSELEDLWPGTDQFSREERAQVIAAWPNNPEAREREWTGWWEGNINA